MEVRGKEKKEEPAWLLQRPRDARRRDDGHVQQCSFHALDARDPLGGNDLPDAQVLEKGSRSRADRVDTAVPAIPQRRGLRLGRNGSREVALNTTGLPMRPSAIC